MAVQASQMIVRVATEGVDASKQQLKSMGQTVSETSSGFRSMLGNALSFAAGQAVFNLVGNAVGFLKNQVSDSISLAIQHQDIMTQTAKVLKSTGDASGMTQQSLEALASSLEKTTYFSKDQTEAGENMLLTFTNIGKDVFPQATQTMLDMSKAMGQDVKSTAIQMGKALNDPVQGITALSRVGVTFTQNQKDMIKQMVDAGNVAGAQKIVLAELQREFGGSADATQTFGGRMAILTNRLDDVKEKIATALFPVLDGLTGFVESNVMPSLDNFSDWFSHAAIPAIENFSTSVRQGLQRAIQDADNWINQFLNSHKALRDALNNGITAIKNSASSIYEWVTSGHALKDIAQDITHGITDFMNSHKGLRDALINSIDAIKKSANSLYEWSTSGHAIKDIMEALQPAIAYLSPKFKELGDAFVHLKEVAIPALKDIGTSTQQFTQWFEKSGIATKAAKDIFAGIVVTIGLVADGLKLLVNGLSNVITWFTTGGSNAKWLWDMLAGIGSFLVTTFTPVWDKLVSVFNTQIKPAIENMIGAFSRAMPFFEALGAVVGAIGAVIGAVLVGAIEGLVSALAGLIEGLAQTIGGIVQIIAGIFQAIGGIISFFVDLFTGHFDKLYDDVKVAMGGIYEIFAGMWNAIAGIFEAVIGVIGGFLSGFVNGFIGFFKFLYDELIGHSIIPDIVNGMVKWFQDALNIITGFFGGIGQWFHDRFTEAYNGIKNALGEVDGWVRDNLVKPFTDGLATIGGVFSSIAKLIQDATSSNWTSIPGDLHALHLPGFVSGTSYAPGGWAQLAEQGMELVTSPSIGYLPQGAKVYSASQTAQMMSGGYGASGGQQPIILVMEGRTVARGLMPHFVQEIRNGVGVKF
jgi:phage-related protein